MASPIKRIVLRMPPPAPFPSEELNRIFKRGGYTYGADETVSLAAKCQVQRKLGKGGNGDVQEVLMDGKLYALKTCEFLNHAEFEFGREEVVYHEARKHENLCRLIDYQLNRREMTSHILMELCKGGSLHDELERLRSSGERMPKETVWKYFVQILDGLHFMHASDSRPRNSEFAGVLVHSDLKPMNILFADAERQKIKIGDFGLVKHLDGEMCADRSGTWLYMSPEMIRQEPFNEKADIFALGLILYEMMNGHHPFENFDTELVSIYSHPDPFTELEITGFEGDRTLVRLLRRMLSMNPKHRPSTSELLLNCDVREHMLKIKLAAAEKEIEELKRCRDIQVATHQESVKAQAVQCEREFQEAQKAHIMELQIQKEHLEWKQRQQATVHLHELQAEVNRRRYAEYVAERERQDAARYHARYQHYKAEWMAERGFGNRQHAGEPSRPPASDRHAADAKGCGPVRHGERARGVAHPYRNSPPRWVQ